MRHLFLNLTFVSVLATGLLFCSPSHAQFNTVSRDSSVYRLIGQQEEDLSSGHSSGSSSEMFNKARDKSRQIATSPSTDATIEEGKYYEMPGADIGQRKFLGKQVQEQYIEQEGKKGSLLSRLFGKSSRTSEVGMKGHGKKVFGKNIFGKKKKNSPQVIIMPIQTVIDGLSGNVAGQRSRVQIDKYIEESDTDLLFRNLSAEDLNRLDLLSQRSTVSMPLQRFYLTSKFGYRKDPLGQGTRFHDGIDLRCSYEPVFAMLPGVVVKTQFGNTGYGNYVVLNHGNIECLYGHLSEIGVEVGDVVQAGDVVAISGNTGRSTAPHLHVKMTYMGQRVDPLVFIDYINDYIHQLHSQLYGEGVSGDWVDSELTVENLISAMQHYGLHHQRVVLAQALLETGKFTSAVCREKNNLFGLTRRDGRYYEFDTWQDSVKGYRDMIQYRYKGGDYYEFLRKVPYAEDPNYIFKVKQIEGQLGGLGL